MSAFSSVHFLIRLLSVAIAAGPELPCASAVYFIYMVARGMRGDVTDFKKHSICMHPTSLPHNAYLTTIPLI